MGFIDSLNEAFQEKVEVSASGKQAEEEQEGADPDEPEEGESDPDDLLDDEPKVSMEQIKKRFDALYKEAKKSLPKNAKPEEIRAEAFRLLKAEFPAELEDVEME